ncbi:MAG: energy-coupling factor transporter transmembrane component T family protein [Fervidobacterium sp.]
MKLLSLYVEKKSFIHELSPITKLLYAVTSVTITLLFPSLTVGIVFLTISIFLSIISKVTKHMLKLISIVLLLSISIVIIQGIFYTNNEVILFKLGKFSVYREGLLHSFVIVLRLFNMIVSFGVLILTTRPSDLVDHLVQKGLSPRFGYVLSSVLQIIPQMLSTASTILDAQRSRGLETEGNILKKLRAFFALIGPLVLSSLMEARERAMAIEMRGFNVENWKNRTSLKEIKETLVDKILTQFFTFLIFFSLLWRILLWII